MNQSLRRLFSIICATMASLLLAITSSADPLSGEIMKFDQEPMINTAVGGQTVYGHDELSTAYGVGNAAMPPLNYDGRFMADDFADNLSDPVVHITWWGSYLNDNAPTPQQHVQKFLIAFETNVPAPPGGFSQPGSVLQYEVVTAGAAFTRFRHLHRNAGARPRSRLA